MRTLTYRGLPHFLARSARFSRFLAAAAGMVVLARALRSAQFSFRHKVVLVTGGSRGLGLILARELSNRGARVAICARDEAELERARTDLSSKGAQVWTFPCDLSRPNEIEEVVRKVESEVGPIDLLVNNAGIIQVGPQEEMTFEDYDQAMKLHFEAPLRACLAVLPSMRSRRSGRILNIVSIGGKVAVPHLLPYTASKFALSGLSEGLRVELAKEGIIVTTVHPGLMRTGSPPRAHFKGQHRKEFAWFALGASSPFTSMNAQRAARKILWAVRSGRAEVVLSMQAKALVLVHALMPGLFTQLFSWVNRLLPSPGGIGTGHALGKDSRSSLAPHWLTALTDRASARHNEL